MSPVPINARSKSRPWSPVPATGLVLSLALLLSGCGGSPAVRYVTLQGPAASACIPAPGAAARSVQLLQLTLPEGVDRPQLVSRIGDNSLKVDEQARWAEPLRSALAGILASELSQALVCAPVVLRPVGIEDSAWKLAVEIQRLEARPGRSVLLEAVWSLRSRVGGKTLSARAVLEEPLPGETPEAMAAAQSRAAVRLARDIARAIETQAAGS